MAGAFTHFLILTVNACAELAESFYVGDAAGRVYDFADCDKCAHCLPFMTLLVVGAGHCRRRAPLRLCRGVPARYQHCRLCQYIEPQGAGLQGLCRRHRPALPGARGFVRVRSSHMPGATHPRHM